MKYEDLRDGAWYVLALPFPSGVNPDEHSPSKEDEPCVVIVRANSIGGSPRFKLTHWGETPDVRQQGAYRVDFDGTIVPTHKEGPCPAPQLTLNNLARIPASE